MDERTPIVLDDEQWEHVVEVTHGLAAACYQCGACTAVCPWGSVLEQPLSIREMVRRAQLGIEDGEVDLWRCTACRQCLSQCPRGVDVPELFRALRNEAWNQQQAPEGLASVMWDVHWDGNPWGRPPSERWAWARDLDLPQYTPEHELLLYVGCSVAYDARLQKVARAVVELLRAADVDFGVLEDEPCCGESVMALGNEGFLTEIVERNSEQFREAGITELVAISPHCFDMFESYHRDAGFRSRHYTQLLVELLDEGRLLLGAAESGATAVTFQDPCFLGRGRGLYEPPRQLLTAVDGIELREMADNREQALCCGGGGGRMWIETPAEERLAVLRAREAQATGAEVLATACPSCLSCLEDGLKVIGTGETRVMDIAELLAEALVPADQAARAQPAQEAVVR